MQEFTFVSGNEGKIKEIKSILNEYGIYFDVEKLDLPEYQGTSIEIVKEKAKLAAKRLNRPVVVDDVSLEFKALNCMPGPYIKWFREAIGLEGLIKMLHGYENKSATAVCNIAYAEPDGDPVVFEGRVTGTIVSKPRGEGFGWDPIFQPNLKSQPDVIDLTYAEMNTIDKNKISHRKKALGKLTEYLINISKLRIEEETKSSINKLSNHIDYIIQRLIYDRRT